jgi:predicted metalloprotease with PDZ domain
MLTGILLLLAAQTAHYTFRVEDPAANLVEARLDLGGLAPDAGPITLRMPQGFAYAQLPKPLLQGELHSDAKITREGPYSWTLDPAGADDVVLEWLVPLEHRAAPEVVGRDEYEYPYLRADHGMLVMGTLVIAPEVIDEEQIEVRFRLPKGWAVHAPWPVQEDGSFAPPNLGSLRDDLIAIGNWDVHQEQVRGMQLTIAFAPGQEKLRAGVVPKAAPIVAAMLDHFGTTPQDGYLFLFGEPQRGGYGGSPKSQSMTLYVAPDLPVDFAIEGMTHLIAHEFHHTWMRARCQPSDELRFLAEGFTDYFAYFVPWRAGMVDDAKFRASLAEKLSTADAAQQAAQTSLQLAGGPAFFEGGAAHDWVYSGGLVLGLWLDLALRKAEAPASLEDLLRVVYEHPRWQDDPVARVEHLLDGLKAQGRPELAESVRAMTESQLPIDWQAHFLSLGYSIERESKPVALSIRANFEGATITGIDPRGCGGRLGLLAGDTLLAVNGIEVSNETEIRAAFPQLVDGEFVLSYTRADGSQIDTIAARPAELIYSLPDKLISALRTK